MKTHIFYLNIVNRTLSINADCKSFLSVFFLKTETKTETGLGSRPKLYILFLKTGMFGYQGNKRPMPRQWEGWHRLPIPLDNRSKSWHQLLSASVVDANLPISSALASGYIGNQVTKLMIQVCINYP
jgi:hypothetical protein